MSKKVVHYKEPCPDPYDMWVLNGGQRYFNVKCGADPDRAEGSLYWDEVTCKKCLKHNVVKKHKKIKIDKKKLNAYVKLLKAYIKKV